MEVELERKEEEKRRALEERKEKGGKDREGEERK